MRTVFKCIALGLGLTTTASASFVSNILFPPAAAQSKACTSGFNAGRDLSDDEAYAAYRYSMMASYAIFGQTKRTNYQGGELHTPLTRVFNACESAAKGLNDRPKPAEYANQVITLYIDGTEPDTPRTSARYVVQLGLIDRSGKTLVTVRPDRSWVGEDDMWSPLCRPGKSCVYTGKNAYFFDLSRMPNLAAVAAKASGIRVTLSRGYGVEQYEFDQKFIGADGPLR